MRDIPANALLKIAGYFRSRVAGLLRTLFFVAQE